MAELPSTATDHGFGIATILARRGGGGAAAIGAAFGVALDDAPGTVAIPGARLIGTAPGQWIAIEEGAARPDFAAMLALRIGAAAHVVDQTGGYVRVSLAGADAERLLQGGVSIDLDRDAFPPGSAATTDIGHVGVTLWRTASDAFALVAFGSFADDLCHWLDEARRP